MSSFFFYGFEEQQINLKKFKSNFNYIIKLIYTGFIWIIIRFCRLSNKKLFVFGTKIYFFLYYIFFSSGIRITVLGLERHLKHFCRVVIITTARNFSFEQFGQESLKRKPFGTKLLSSPRVNLALCSS